ncbi:type II toxin-antitoxin system prevent-host-death family antitoxin [Rhodococcus marinonascens]|uniref:type II toxin-antitoxin system prevent-host-death family antitoxin n=1 Tax=Rhodococcus marinonascens TaxID=38311 RepID=UPI0009328A45|nr:type II toxin-antitoxin system prevent-host-death family antitoxin [Rhodococcus marinonascens]
MLTALTATDARNSLFALIKQVNADHITVEIVTKGGKCRWRITNPWARSRAENGRTLDYLPALNDRRKRPELQSSGLLSPI